MPVRPGNSIRTINNCRLVTFPRSDESYEAIEGRRIKLGDTHPHTIESLNQIIDLYEAWNKPEKAEKWRTELPRE